jgi:2-oxoglutarate dehydrogenase E2 component (dihydrolipoamide succinyltransferase)
MQVEVKVPQLSESVSEATLVAWRKKAGEPVKRDENLIDVETDKVVLELPSPVDGVLAKIIKKDGDSVTSGEIIAMIDTEGKATVAPQQAAVAPVKTAAAPAQTAAAPAKAGAQPEAGASASPSAAKIAAEKGIDTSTHRWIGTRRPCHQGRCDRRRPTRAGEAGERAGSTAHRRPHRPARADVAPAPAHRRAPHQSQSTAAILTTFNEVNMQAVIDLRNRYKDKFEKEHGVKLGFMSFFVKAAVHALKKYPVVNASIDGTDIVYHGYYDVGVAVGSERGLVVPIIRNADQLTFAQIELTIADFGKRGEGRKDHSGGAHRRNVLDLQRRRLRVDAFHADHQSSAKRDPGRARDQGAPGGRERAGRDPADELPGTLVRPSHRRRPRGGAVAGGDEGSARGPGAAGPGHLRPAWLGASA